ncbi:hypothetical protein [Klebsiella pneumoniae]|uniref:hypothetical protein n=1 Tax=Klebsiella pneumoniae TaxID=573 RepID=UPI0016462B7C|nr:hypothetical protein [Klebsiella pneumoniae]
MVILPSPRSSDADGPSFTALPAKEGDERAMVAAAMIGIIQLRKKNKKESRE